MSDLSGNGQAMRPIRFLSAKLEESGVVHTSGVLDANGREIAEYVAIRYEAEVVQGDPRKEEAMLDVIIRKDGVFEFVVWHPRHVGIAPPFSTCTFQFDPKSVTVQKTDQT
jgi:hypothetical protein